VSTLFTVVRGEPTVEQVAALAAVLRVRARAPVAQHDATPDAPSLWAAPVLRQPQVTGPGAWRASGLPH